MRYTFEPIPTILPMTDVMRTEAASHSEAVRLSMPFRVPRGWSSTDASIQMLCTPLTLDPLDEVRWRYRARFDAMVAE